MIFVTVGAQMPFDRLLGWVDDWAVEHERRDVIAQIGDSPYQPRLLQVIPFMNPPAFRAQLQKADLVIAHAGMGSIINALEFGKPIVLVARQGRLGETRNDHQVATARRFAAEGMVRVADSPNELSREIARLEQPGENPRIPSHAQPELLDRLRTFATNS